MTISVVNAHNFILLKVLIFGIFLFFHARYKLQKTAMTPLGSQKLLGESAPNFFWDKYTSFRRQIFIFIFIGGLETRLSSGWNKKIAKSTLFLTNFVDSKKKK